MHRSTHASTNFGSTLGSVAMIIERELRDQIAAAVSGRVSLNDLYTWLIGRSWNMHKDSAPSAIELAASVEELFFDRSDGLISDDALRSMLISLLNDVAFDAEVIDDQNSVLVTKTSSSISQVIDNATPTVLATDSDLRITASLATMMSPRPFAFQQ
jgi:hypothetical protein